jgi:hypothetical protein
MALEVRQGPTWAFSGVGFCSRRKLYVIDGDIIVVLKILGCNTGAMDEELVLEIRILRVRRTGPGIHYFKDEERRTAFTEGYLQ